MSYMKSTEKCTSCKCNVNGVCIVCFMPVDRAMAYLGECECAQPREFTFRHPPEFPNIIGFAGFARAGKDTCADMVKAMFPDVYTRSAFANRLKYECGLMLSMVEDDFPDLREDEGKIKYRDFLVFWGKFRRKQQEDYWIKNLECDGCRVTSRTIISDVRYPNEADWIHKNKGIVIYVSRPSAVPANSEEHYTVNEILRNGMDDYRIDNEGSLEDLREKVIKLISEVIYAEKVCKDVPGNS